MKRTNLRMYEYNCVECGKRFKSKYFRKYCDKFCFKINQFKKRILKIQNEMKNLEEGIEKLQKERGD